MRLWDKTLLEMRNLVDLSCIKTVTSLHHLEPDENPSDIWLARDRFTEHVHVSREIREYIAEVLRDLNRYDFEVESAFYRVEHKHWNSLEKKRT